MPPPPYLPEASRRKFTCYVCGLETDDLEAMCVHIRETHEEGRDFVLCPLARCQRPVRDVRVHFKSAHPREKVPTKGQMRAIVWRDQGKKKSGPRFKEGYYTSAKNGMMDMHYRSGWELDVYRLLEEMNEIVSYRVEPTTIGYWHLGKHRQYHPDLFVEYADGTIELWEIKPNNQKNLPMNQAKWAAAAEYCFARGIDFCVKTEKSIEAMRRDVATRPVIRIDEQGQVGDRPPPAPSC